MLDEYVKDILKQKGLPPNMDPEVHTQLVKDVTQMAEDLINKRLLDALSDEQFDQLEKIAGHQPDQKSIQDFIDKNLPNKQQIVTEALTDFRNTYLGTT